MSKEHLPICRKCYEEADRAKWPHLFCDRKHAETRSTRATDATYRRKAPPVWRWNGEMWECCLKTGDPLYPFLCHATELAMENLAVLVARQRDYGAENIAQSGDGGLLVRMRDKLARAWHLHVTGAPPTGEAVDDTDLDLANYALIRRMVRRGLWPAPVKRIVLRELPEEDV